MRIGILSLFFATIFLTVPSSAQHISSLQADISATREAIIALDGRNKHQEGSVLWSMAEMESSILRLTLAALESRRLALEGKVSEEISLPSVLPNPELASQILEDISLQIEQVQEAEAEAGESGGLLQALARTRVLTEKIALASLKLAYYQVAYGVAIPRISTTKTVDSDEVNSSDAEISIAENAKEEMPNWADINHPEIDYSSHPFPSLASTGRKFIGWWAVGEDRAAIDDSPEMTAINVSAWSERRYGDQNLLIAQCVENQLAIVYSTDDLIWGEYDSNALPLVVRFDSQPAQNVRWRKLLSNKGAGQFGELALPVFQSILAAKKIFVRLKKRRGGSVDTTFKVAGADRALEMVANTCGKTTLALGRKDYKVIQELLKAAGYYLGPH